jgi:hypothetical protein
VDVAGIELGTIGVILVVLVALALGLWTLWVVLFFDSVGWGCLVDSRGAAKGDRCSGRARST